MDLTSSHPTLTRAELKSQLPAASGKHGFAMRLALRNGSVTRQMRLDYLTRLISR